MADRKIWTAPFNDAIRMGRRSCVDKDPTQPPSATLEHIPLPSTTLAAPGTEPQI